MKTSHPFIYICSVLRTGSTLVQELLTHAPESLIFHEPRFAVKAFQNQEVSGEMLVKEYGFTKPEMSYSSISRFLYEITRKIPQVGVKEIRNANWLMYLNLFDDIRFVLTGRNPRDIYISCFKQLQRSDHWKPAYPPLSPLGLFREVIPEIEAQNGILGMGLDIFKVRYEDLVGETDAVASDLLRFCGSPLEHAGIPGDFHQRIERGRYEIEKHGHAVTDSSVGLYSKERDVRLLKDAEDFYRLMWEYNKVWGY